MKEFLIKLEDQWLINGIERYGKLRNLDFQTSLIELTKMGLYIFEETGKLFQKEVLEKIQSAIQTGKIRPHDFIAKLLYEIKTEVKWG